jgi:fructose-1,6-bisphosphatase/inositol monophosphatase family enzyme
VSSVLEYLYILQGFVHGFLRGSVNAADYAAGELDLSGLQYAVPLRRPLFVHRLAQPRA